MAMISAEQYRNIAKNDLAGFFQAAQSLGLKISFHDFIAYIDNLSPGFLKILGESIEIYGESAYDLYYGMGLQSGGNIPASRIELQQFIIALKEDVEKPKFSKIVEGIGEDLVKATEVAASGLGAVFTNLPLIIAGGLGLFLLVRFKK